MSRSFFYHEIFFTNILRILDERGMTNDELSERSGISASFISDLARGKANPSLRTMEAIAAALDTALPALLESTDLDRAALDELAGGKAKSSLPKGYERVTVILTSFEAFVAKGQDEANRKKTA
ncbi:MAG: transcriptional regulator [Nitrosospira sp.]